MRYLDKNKKSLANRIFKVSGLINILRKNVSKENLRAHAELGRRKSQLRSPGGVGMGGVGWGWHRKWGGIRGAKRRKDFQKGVVN